MTVLNCVLQFVEEKSNVDGLDVEKCPENVQFVNVVEWMTFRAGEECWGLDRVRRFALFGDSDFINILESGLVFATEKPFALVFDSSGSALDDLAKKEEEKPVKFLWFQGVEDMVLWVPIPPKTTKKDLKVSEQQSMQNLATQFLVRSSLKSKDGRGFHLICSRNIFHNHKCSLCSTIRNILGENL